MFLVNFSESFFLFLIPKKNKAQKRKIKLAFLKLNINRLKKSNYVSCEVFLICVILYKARSSASLTTWKIFDTKENQNAESVFMYRRSFAYRKACLPKEYTKILLNFDN